MNVLIVEDDATIAEAIQTYLENEGFKTIYASTIQEAKNSVSKNLDLILLDYNLPDGKGYDFCKHVRKISNIPLIFITVNDSEKDIIKCLDIGADDYVTKPFKLSIMLSRINAVLRRSRPNNTNLIVCDDITLDKNSGIVFSNSKRVNLTALEFRLLVILMENMTQILTRNILLEKLWDSNENFVNNNTLTVTVKRLREKLGFPPCIKTIRGVGYRMESHNE